MNCYESNSEHGPIRQSGPKARKLTLYVACCDEAALTYHDAIGQSCQYIFRESEWTLDMVDITENPAVARDKQVVATPLLVVEMGKRVKRIVGYLQPHNLDRLLSISNENYSYGLQAEEMRKAAAEMQRQAKLMLEQSRRMEKDPRNKGQ